MITLNFSKFYKWQNLEVVELKSYKDFFDFYIKSSKKGLIFNVVDDGNTK